MRTLGSYALIFIRSGKGRYRDQRGVDSPFQAGDLILVFPELPHAYGSPSNDWEQIYVVFHGPQFELLERAGVLDPQSPLWRLGPVAHWQHRLEELFPQDAAPRNESEATRALGHFTSLITDMAAAHAAARRSPHEAWLGESMRLLAEPSAQGWLTPQETARQVGLSYENFRKLFSKHAGESPGAFQKRRRIEHACAQIYQSSRTFKDLADEHGFCDVFHFSKVFTQVMGESPSAYRKRLNGP